MLPRSPISSLFFFNDTATTEIYTLSLHDALPILRLSGRSLNSSARASPNGRMPVPASKIMISDRKSTRLNSSHGYISYAVFCLKKKKTHNARSADPGHAIREPNTVRQHQSGVDRD